METPDNILEVNDLAKRFNLEAGFFSSFGKFVYAVNGISFAVKRNSALGLVGESGCGKTSTARLLVRMYESDSGNAVFTSGGEKLDVFSLKGAALKEYRRKVKYVFQDPARSLNSRMSVYRILTDGWRHSAIWPGEKKAREAAASIMEEVGLSASDLERRPGDFSGGQRQRISIARGLLMEPELLICDEVISALDVSIQGQILNLLLDLRKARNLSFIFIAHDLRASCFFCDRIAVMYRGEIMEEADAADLYLTAAHPYTKMLFASVATGTSNSRAVSNTTSAPQAEVHGEVTDSASLEAESGHFTQGCLFAERCPHAFEKCFAEKPALKPLPTDTGNHLARCHLTG